jgi:hypothetical protein
LYLDYPGQKEFDEILVDNLHDQDHFNDRWTNFTEEIEKEIGKEITSASYGLGPSFGSIVLLNTTTVDDLTRNQELHFYVSLIGPFYTIFGQDNNTVKVNQGGSYRSTNYVVVSPENEFADTFKLLCDRIENRFKGYRFLPFGICQQTINGLEVRFSDENPASVFQALFDNNADLKACKIIGKEYFKSEDWIKEGYIEPEGSWTAYPPMEYMLSENKFMSAIFTRLKHDDSPTLKHVKSFQRSRRVKLQNRLYTIRYELNIVKP